MCWSAPVPAPSTLHLWCYPPPQTCDCNQMPGLCWSLSAETPVASSLQHRNLMSLLWWYHIMKMCCDMWCHVIWHYDLMWRAGQKLDVLVMMISHYDDVLWHLMSCDMTLWFDVAWYDDVMWYDVIWHSDVMWRDMTMWCVVIWCDMAFWCDVAWYDVTWYYVIWHPDVMWCDMMWYDVIWCDLMYCNVSDSVSESITSCQMFNWFLTFLEQRSLSRMRSSDHS